MEQFDPTIVNVEHGFIAFLDALGTRGRWRESEVHEALTRWLLLQVEIRAAAQPYKVATSIAPLPTGQTRSLVEVEGGVQLFSDSLIISFEPAEHADPAAALTSVCSILNLIFVESARAGVLLRGAVSHGSFLRASNIIVGRAVDEANEWRDAADWAGILFTPTAEYEIERVIGLHLPSGKHLHVAGTALWAVPLRPGLGRTKLEGETWVLDWTSRGKGIGRWLTEQFSRAPVGIDVEAKKRNTLAFLDGVAEAQEKDGDIPVPPDAVDHPFLSGHPPGITHFGTPEEIAFWSAERGYHRKPWDPKPADREKGVPPLGS